MIVDPHQYVLSLYNDTGRRLLGSVKVTPDWGPAREAAIFDQTRRGMSAAVTASVIEIQPLWHAQSGQPNVAGFRANLCAGDRVMAHHDFGITYFAGAARKASSIFIGKGMLKAGDIFHYAVAATPRREQAISPGRIGVQVEDAPLRTSVANLRAFLGESLSLGKHDPADIRVFVRWDVLREVSALTRAAAPNETGGVLLGRLHGDPSVPDLFLEITGQIRAPAQPQLSSLRFGPDTWTAMRRRHEQSGDQSLWVGWWHSHAFYHAACAKCGKPPGQCESAEPGLSDDDCHVHRTVFARAFNVALLLTDSPCDGMSWSMFGWRSGRIQERGFGVIGAPLTGAVNIVQGVSHAA